jgi:AraC-like DNA-binding protein
MADPQHNWLIRAPGGIERIEASLAGAAYAPHRHDTYAIGVTLEGVQSFDYRGATRHSQPGGLVILHPDELHDGRAGDGGRFRYRTAYVPPALIQAALGGQPLPFIAGGLSDDPRLCAAVRALLDDYGRPMDGLEQDDGLYDLATALQAAAGDARPVRIADHRAALAARDFIEASLELGCSLDQLEAATRQDRWQLSRDFRALFGASPHRYLTFRRLDRARVLLLNGEPLASAASACGFADQSHFGRRFKQAFGLTPKAWLAAMGGPHERSISARRARPN